MGVLSKEDLKPYLNLDATTSQDALIDLVIAQAEEWVANHAGPLASTTVTKQLVARGRYLVVPVTPVLSVTSVTHVESGTVVTLEADDIDLGAGVLEGDTICDGEAYTVVYQAGYTVPPEKLKRAAIEYARYLWRPQRGPQNKQGNIDDSMASLRMAELLIQDNSLPGFS